MAVDDGKKVESSTQVINLLSRRLEICFQKIMKPNYSDKGNDDWNTKRKLINAVKDDKEFSSVFMTLK